MCPQPHYADFQSCTGSAGIRLTSAHGPCGHSHQGLAGNLLTSSGETFGSRRDAASRVPTLSDTPSITRYRLTRGILGALLLIAVMAAAGHGAASGSQTVTVSAVQAIDITVPAAESIASTPPGSCGTTSTTVNVKSNKYWNLQVRSEPTNYANGKAKNGSSTEMVNAFPYRRGGRGLVYQHHLLVR